MSLENFGMIFENNVTLVLDGVTHTIGTDHKHYESVRNAVRDEDWDTARAIVDLGTPITNWGEGRFTVEHGELLLDGNAIPFNQVADKCFRMIEAGNSPDSMANFVTRLFENPRYNVVISFLGFCDKAGFVITPDGRVVAYKSIQADYTDWHTGTVDNRPSDDPDNPNIVSMPPFMVNDNDEVACAEGYHGATLGFAENFNRMPDRRLIALLVAPEHVVSVPKHGDGEKFRCYKYEVWQEIGGEGFLEPGVEVVDPSQNNEDAYDDDLGDDDGYDHDLR
jgi:hypothetical protein